MSPLRASRLGERQPANAVALVEGVWPQAGSPLTSNGRKVLQPQTPIWYMETEIDLDLPNLCNS